MNQRRSPPTVPEEWPSDTNAVPPPVRTTCAVPRRPAPSGTGLPFCTISTLFQSPTSALASRAISGLPAESDSDDWARKDEEKRAAAESSRRRRTRVILSFHSIMSLASVAQPFRQASPQLVNLLSLKSPDCTCVSI